MRTIFSAPKSSVLAASVVALLLVCVAHAVAQSFHWKLIHDGITMQYIAAMMMQGVLPYRDIFDMNFPLTYWIHALGMALLGKSDIATRTYDLLWCYFGSFTVAACIWRQSRAAALAAGCCFALLHVASGYMNQLQRDFFMAPLLVGSLFFCLRSSHPLIAGLLVGAACSIKPVAGVFALFVLLLTPRQRIADYLVGGAVVPVLSCAWMLGLGIFDEFWDILSNFTLPIFASSAFENTFPFRHDVPVIAVLAAIFHFAVCRNLLFTRESLLLLAGLGYGLLHYYLQQKGYDQHLYPFWGMLCLMVGIGVAKLADNHPLETWCCAAVILISILMVRPAAFLWKDAGFFNATPLVARSEQLDAQLSRYNLPRSGAQVQVLEDVFGTMWRMAYLHNWKPQMRFMYPFILYAAKDNPTMRRYRREFTVSLLTSPPRMILLSSNSWPQYKQRVFPEFMQQPAMDILLEQHYFPATGNQRMRIWLRKY